MSEINEELSFNDIDEISFDLDDDEESLAYPELSKKPEQEQPKEQPKTEKRKKSPPKAEILGDDSAEIKTTTAKQTRTRKTKSPEKPTTPKQTRSAGASATTRTRSPKTQTATTAAQFGENTAEAYEEYKEFFVKFLPDAVQDQKDKPKRGFGAKKQSTKEDIKEAFKIIETRNAQIKQFYDEKPNSVTATARVTETAIKYTEAGQNKSAAITQMAKNKISFVIPTENADLKEFFGLKALKTINAFKVNSVKNTLEFDPVFSYVLTNKPPRIRPGAIDYNIPDYIGLIQSLKISKFNYFKIFEKRATVLAMFNDRKEQLRELWDTAKDLIEQTEKQGDAVEIWKILMNNDNFRKICIENYTPSALFSKCFAQFFKNNYAENFDLFTNELRAISFIFTPLAYSSEYMNERTKLAGIPKIKNVLEIYDPKRKDWVKKLIE